jgi:hypothetical protein
MVGLAVAGCVSTGNQGLSGLHSISTLAIQESTLCRAGKSGLAPSGHSVKSGGEVDITKSLSLLCPYHGTLI